MIIHVHPFGTADTVDNLMRVVLIASGGEFRRINREYVMGLLKTNRIKVEPLQPTVCKRCWGRRAVNEVTIGATEAIVPYCQACTNAVITNHSTRLEIEDEANHLRSQHVSEWSVNDYITEQLSRRIIK